MKLLCKTAVAAFVLFGMIASRSWAQSLTTTEKGALGGAALGAGTGAIVGAGVHHPVKGALIGGGLGAVTGGVIGHALEGQENNQKRLQNQTAVQQREINYQRAEIRQLRQEQTTSGETGQKTTNSSQEQTE